MSKESSSVRDAAHAYHDLRQLHLNLADFMERRDKAANELKAAELGIENTKKAIASKHLDLIDLQAGEDWA